MSLKERKKIFLLGVISSYGANAVNMPAGFNGLEAGIGLVDELVCLCCQVGKRNR